jgi:hypothetical protein
LSTDPLKLVHAAAAGSDRAYRQIVALLNPHTKADIARIVPLLKALFPDYVNEVRADPGNDFQAGIWRMVHKGDEIGRIPTSELSRRISAAVNSNGPKTSLK